MSGFEIHLLGMLVFSAVLLIATVGNLIVLPVLGRRKRPPVADPPRVAVLVPARNEERGIVACLESLLGQDYPDFSVSVLDDGSSDATPELLRGLQRRYPELRVIHGRPPPAGWLGKHWACHQLAAGADAELLLFTDADTSHHPRTLADAVAELRHRRAELLSLLPRQIMRTPGEQLLVPLMTWCIVSFLPLALLRLLKRPALAPANGQFMLFRRRTYERIGGHAAVRDHATDDVALGRAVVKNRGRLAFADGTRRVTCRMYTGFGEAFAGFSKNFFAIFNYKLLIFLFAWLWVAFLYWEPPVLLTLDLLGAPLSPFVFWLAAATLGASLLQWLLVYLRFGFPVWAALGHPVVALLGTLTALNSLRLTRRGSARWKGRKLIRRR
jgi:chlorobactene glucosyltransferase